MAQADNLEHTKSRFLPELDSCKPVAAGLFGYSISDGRIRSFIPMPGYVRELEQLPNFSPPSVDLFIAQYVRSNAGKDKSAS